MDKVEESVEELSVKIKALLDKGINSLGIADAFALGTFDKELAGIGLVRVLDGCVVVNGEWCRKAIQHLVGCPDDLSDPIYYKEAEEDGHQG